jgi:hypothetical protein
LALHNVSLQQLQPYPTKWRCKLLRCWERKQLISKCVTSNDNWKKSKIITRRIPINTRRIPIRSSNLHGTQATSCRSLATFLRSTCQQH